MDALHFKKTLENDGEIKLTGLPAKKGDEAEVIIVFKHSRGQRKLTLGELLESDVVGMWKDRTDIGDSVEFARRLRKSVRKHRE